MSEAPPPAPQLRLAEDIRGRVRLGLVAAAPVAVAPAGPALLGAIDRVRAELVARFAGRSPAQIDELAPARELYRAFGIDPTKTRPSSEALLRRVLRDRPLPRVSNAVDLGNLLALRFLLPLGLYDASEIDGEVELRRGRPGESFRGIRKDEVHLGGRPVLVDRRGPFGNPSSDSLRTCVGRSTVALWLVVFAPHAFGVPLLREHVETARQAMATHLARAGTAVATHGEVRD